MSYQVDLSSAARRQLKKLPTDTQVEILAALTELEATPRPMGVAKMSGQDAYRIHVGKYRVIYEISDEVLVVVVKVGHRREVYR